MNKKIIVSIVLISIFCLTIVSALSFKEAFDNVVSRPFNDFITGRGFLDVFQPPTGQSCSKEGGVDYNKQGTVTFQNDPSLGTGSKPDSCTSASELKEWYCDVDGKTPKFELHTCGSGLFCDVGACVTEPQQDNIWHPIGGDRTCPGGKFVTGWKDPNKDYKQDAFLCSNLNTYQAANCGWVSIKQGSGAYCPTGKYVAGWRDGNADWIQDSFLCCNPNTENLPQENCELVRISSLGEEVYCPTGKYVAGWIDDVYADYKQDAFVCCEPGTIGDNTYGCSDTDNGKNIFIKGTTKDPFNSKTDSCRVVGYDGKDKKLYWLSEPLESCKPGMSLWGGRGFIHSCSVDESTCDRGILKTERVDITPGLECPTKICYQGQCACENDVDCGAGYKCTNWNDDLRATFCEEETTPTTPTPTPTTGCLLNNIYYPIGARKGNDYCDYILNEYKWETQKINGITCVNSWECKTNLCIDTKCSKLPTISAPSAAECIGCETLLMTLETICLPPGTRKAGKYCGLKDDGTYGMIDQIAQDAADISCENDYECKTNVCIQGECTTPKAETGFLKRIWCKITNPLSSTDCDNKPDSDYCICLTE